MVITMTFTWIVFIIQAIFSSIFLTDLNIDSLAILIIVMTSLFFLFDLSCLNFPKTVFLIFYISYLFRLFLLFFDLYGQEIFVLPNSGLDSEMFHSSAINGLMNGNYGNGHIYSMVLGTLYRFFGNERMIAQFFNVLLSMQAILWVYKTMALYQINEKVKNYTIVVLSFIPNFAIMSSILLRESIIIYLYVLSFYFFSKWFFKNKSFDLLLAYVFGLLVTIFHSGSIVLVVSYSILLILYDQHERRFHFNLKSILVAVSFLIVFLFIFQNYFDVFFLKFANIEEMDDVTDIYVMGASGYSTGYAIENPILNFIINTPLRIFSFIFSPLPWEWRGLQDVIAFVFSSLFYGGILILGLRSVFKENTRNRNIIISILLIIGIGLFVFAWGVSNAGTALRHRDKFIGLFILLLSLVINDEVYRRARV
jgi:hypothetical protein